MNVLFDHMDAVINIIAMIATAISIYLGIRVELVRLHEKDKVHEKDIIRVDTKVDYVGNKLHDHLENHDRRFSDRTGSYPAYKEGQP